MTTTYRNVEISVVSSIFGHVAFFTVGTKKGSTNRRESREAAEAEARGKIDGMLKQGRVKA